MRQGGAGIDVSVALATFRGSRYLAPLLDSLAAQSRLPDELIVSDDGSDDDTVLILETFARRAPFPVNIIRQPRNVGVLDNFYSAFRGCAGEVIFYCDQDDIWDPRKIELMVEPFASPRVHFAAHRSAVVDQFLNGDGVVPKNPRYGTIKFPANPRFLYAHGHQMAFHRDVLKVMETLRPYLATEAPSLANNFDVYIPFCASLIGDVYLSPLPLVQFRRHSESVSSLAKAQARQSRVARLSASASSTASALGERVALLQEAEGNFPENAEQVGCVLSALKGDLRVARAIADVGVGHFPERLGKLVRALIELLRPAPQFSNRRPVREAATAAASFLSPVSD